MNSQNEAKHIIVTTVDDAERLMGVLRRSAARTQEWLRAQHGSDPLDVLRCMKFRQVGYHPLEDRELNLVEQINQTWTYAVAIAAAKQLLLLHSDAAGFLLAPGAHAQLELDIMSVAPGLVGAETFAATHPKSNNKLALDLKKLAARPETHRYSFFMSPAFPGNRRLHQFEHSGVQVWSVDF